MLKTLILFIALCSFSLNAQDTIRFTYAPGQDKFSTEMHQFIDTIFESFDIKDYDSIVIQSYVNDPEKSSIQALMAKKRLNDAWVNTSKQSYIELLNIKYIRYPILIEARDPNFIDLIFY